MDTQTRETFWDKAKKDWLRNYSLYLIVSPVILYYIVFHYAPIYGAIIAFKDYLPMKGVLGSPWVGFKHFQDFFESYYFWRVLKNTLVISLTSLVFGFPAPIILALLINEVKKKLFSRFVQTVTYMPHFISLVVVCGLVLDFTRDSGIINAIIGLFGGDKVTMLNHPGYFVPVYVTSEIWQEIGWGSIIYLAAMGSIDPQQYEAATIDGAGRWKQTVHVTLPGIAPTIMILLILKIGGILSVGYEKIILLYNPAIYETADVISTYVYRKGLQEFAWSFSSAVGLFNSTINFVLLLTANWLSRKVNQSSLW
ncbi:sugar ABC transporter permease [Paenibacillus agaridevorans]|uniref:Sugar ABC transporter permease n=1 Tax=Paenibacillus agaridevorans TaxID=171404 RepID=A0A2R5F1A4_9BACL|nr:ABC transporter permease subunit [Paenibacillus agaridevorans]GBG11228.1 sugar ABC transporter permease [Paenibacillus agaridevorans]